MTGSAFSSQKGRAGQGGIQMPIKLLVEVVVMMELKNLQKNGKLMLKDRKPLKKIKEAIQVTKKPVPDVKILQKKLTMVLILEDLDILHWLELLVVLIREVVVRCTALMVFAEHISDHDQRELPKKEEDMARRVQVELW